MNFSGLFTFLELPPVERVKSKSLLEQLMDHIAVLYRFHDRPITYLYNTLHYYEYRIRNRLALKKKLVSCIIGSLKDVRPPGWCLTDQYLDMIRYLLFCLLFMFVFFSCLFISFSDKIQSIKLILIIRKSGQ